MSPDVDVFHFLALAFSNEIKDVKVLEISTELVSEIDAVGWVAACCSPGRIIKEANKRRQEGTLLSVWSLDGKIFVKTSPYGSPVRIFSEEDLDQL